jgi:hypothetical protein
MPIRGDPGIRNCDHSRCRSASFLSPFEGQTLLDFFRPGEVSLRYLVSAYHRSEQPDEEISCQETGIQSTVVL